MQLCLYCERISESVSAKRCPLLPVYFSYVNGIKRSHDFVPAQPLWQRVPTHSEHGEMLSDFMMIIPRLGKQTAAYIQNVIAKLEKVFAAYGDKVVFVDLNLKINVLWVSLKPVPGLSLELATAIHVSVPEARLVAQNFR